MSTVVPIEGFAERVRRSFERQQVMKTLGVELVRVTPGFVELALPFSEALTQQHGFLHAGVVATALDSACGYAALSLMPADAGVLTIEYKVNLLAPGKGERFSLRASVTKPGRTIMVVDGQAFAVTSETEPKLIATMTGTMMVVKERDGIAD
jgi:uncharacterized protein (TIGR00369 family)